MLKNIVGNFELDGRCKKCRKDVTLKLVLGEPVQIRTGRGGIFRRARYELFLPAAVDGSPRCPHCGWDFFGD